MQEQTNLSVEPRAFTEREAAKYICMSRSFLAQSRMEGNRDNHIPAPRFIKVGRNVRYLREELDNWLDSFQSLEHLNQLNAKG